VGKYFFVIREKIVQSFLQRICLFSIKETARFFFLTFYKTAEILKDLCSGNITFFLLQTNVKERSIETAQDTATKRQQPPQGQCLRHH
jgi:hypothetical protein